MNLYNYYTKPQELDLFDPYITDDATRAYEFAAFHRLSEFKAGETAIAQSPYSACRYARNILRGRFELGEPAIAQSDRWAYEYAMHVIKGVFPAGEAAIARDPEYSLWYAQDVIDGRFELGEPAINSVRKLRIIYNNFLGMLSSS